MVMQGSGNFQTSPFDSSDLVKTSESEKQNDKIPQIIKVHADSIVEYSQSDSRPSLSREDSVISRLSRSTILSHRSIDVAIIPRPEKSITLFDALMKILKQLQVKYSVFSYHEEGIESTHCIEMCSKLENRLSAIQNLKSDYLLKLADKEAELIKIRSNFQSILTSKPSQNTVDIVGCDSFWNANRELCSIESKLEHMSGKLQFQIVEIEGFARLNIFDQYELVVRSCDSKFKTRLKIEKNRQVWDTMNFSVNVAVDDCLYVKFSEIKTLNKTVVLMEKKLPFMNNLIQAEPSIFSFWLTLTGSIKLRVIVQWSPMLDELTKQSISDERNSRLKNINRISTAFEHIIHSGNSDMRSRSPSISSILEKADGDSGNFKDNEGDNSKNVQLRSKQVIQRTGKIDIDFSSDPIKSTVAVSDKTVSVSDSTNPLTHNDELGLTQQTIIDESRSFEKQMPEIAEDAEEIKGEQLSTLAVNKQEQKIIKSDTINETSCLITEAALIQTSNSLISDSTNSLTYNDELGLTQQTVIDESRSFGKQMPEIAEDAEEIKGEQLSALTVNKQEQKIKSDTINETSYLITEAALVQLSDSLISNDHVVECQSNNSNKISSEVEGQCKTAISDQNCTKLDAGAVVLRVREVMSSPDKQPLQLSKSDDEGIVKNLDQITDGRPESMSHVTDNHSRDHND